ncbi:MAG: Mur ligase family protein, partial [Patescibacteria group bacterium]
MKKILVKTLRFLAKKILKKYKPEIIGVTGSFGKTSTKEAVFAVLSSKFNVRRNIKNYNNEIGLPLTIIGAGSPGRSVLGWLGVFFQAFFLLVLKQDYPKILILEMAVDHPGDMDYLVDLALPKIGVVANIGAVHLEYFKTVERIAKEKAKIVTRIKDGWAVLNADNELVLGIKDQVKCPVLTYGLGSKADLRAQEINISHNDLKEKGIAGISFKMIYQGNVMPVLLPNILGEHLVYAALAGAALGIIYGMNLMEISQALQSFKAPKGRMNLIDGIKKTLIIDDTYNAGPDSTLAALKVLGRIPGRRWAVLETCWN